MGYQRIRYCAWIIGLSLLCACGLSSKNQGLLFVSARSGNWELYFLPDAHQGAQSVADLSDEGGLLNLTRYPSSDRYPDLSPRGEDLVFASDRAGAFDLYLVDLSGNNLRLLSESPFPDTTPRWSPDGKQIAFVSERSERNENIYLLDLKTKTPQRLTDDPAADYDPAWFPGSDALAFVSERSGTTNLYRYDLQSGQITALTETEAEKRSPDISPDGKAICFAERQKSGAWQLVVMQLATGERKTLSAEQKWLGVPRWKNKSQIVYSLYRDGRFALEQRDLNEAQPISLLTAQDNREAVWVQ